MSAVCRKVELYGIEAVQWRAALEALVSRSVYLAATREHNSRIAHLTRSDAPSNLIIDMVSISRYITMSQLFLQQGRHSLYPYIQYLYSAALDTNSETADCMHVLLSLWPASTA